MPGLALPGVVLFAFNRPEHLSRSLAALAGNDLAAESELTIYCDGPRNENDLRQTEAVREVACRATGFKSVTIVAREQNLGCAASVIDGVTRSFTEHSKLAIFEDDVLTSPHTLSFLANCLEKYEENQSVFSISAWSPPPSLLKIPATYPYGAYFIPRCNVWGWGTWRERWKRVDWELPDYAAFKCSKTLRKTFNAGGDDLSAMLDAQMDGKLDTWDVRMDYARFKCGCVGLNPTISYTTNIGMGSGTHSTQATKRYDNDISLAAAKPELPDHVFVASDMLAAYRKVYAPPSLLTRAVNKGSRILFGKNLIPL